MDSTATAAYWITATQIDFCAMCTYQVFSSIQPSSSLTCFLRIDAIVVWDWLISLNKERILIWNMRWTPMKFAYLFCRYWVISVVPYLLYCFVVNWHSLEECQRIFRIPVVLAMWNQVAAQVILLLRTYAFFGKNPFILAFLLAALSGVITYQLYVALTQMLLLPFITAPYTKGPCFPVSKPHSAHLLGFFLAPLLFDTIVTVMTIVRAVGIRKECGSNDRIIRTFTREGVFYYIMISIANLVNGIFYFQPRQEISALNIPLSIMLGPILACRLVLDLHKRAAEMPSESLETVAFDSKSISEQRDSSRPRHRRTRNLNGRNNGPSYSSNVMLTTIGSITPDPDIFEQDIGGVMGDDGVRFGHNADAGSGNTVTVVGGHEDGEPVHDGERCPNGTPTPTYHSYDVGLGRSPSQEDFKAGAVRGTSHMEHGASMV